MPTRRQVLSPLSAAFDTARATDAFLVSVLEMGADVPALLDAYERLIAAHGIGQAQRAEGSTLRSISLTHRPGAADPFYDGNQSQFDPVTGMMVYSEAEFTEFNKQLRGTAFESVYHSLPFRVGRARLMVLPPLTVYNMHSDSAPRAHFALTTNPGCWLISQTGKAHHVPADGSLYVFDTTRPHTALNASQLTRVHLTLSMADFEIPRV